MHTDYFHFFQNYERWHDYDVSRCLKISILGKNDFLIWISFGYTTDSREGVVGQCKVAFQK